MIGGGQFWTPIPRLRGSIFHAETHSFLPVSRRTRVENAHFRGRQESPEFESAFLGRSKLRTRQDDGLAPGAPTPRRGEPAAVGRPLGFVAKNR